MISAEALIRDRKEDHCRRDGCSDILQVFNGQDADFRTFRVWHSRRQDMDLSTDPLGASVYLERIQSCIVIDLRVRNFQSLEG